VSLSVFGVRYSYYNVPPAMQAQQGLVSEWWQARPASAWEPQRVTAENALPLAHLSIVDLAPSDDWGSFYVNCRGAQDPRGVWGCAGYEDGRNRARDIIDARCPSGGCWIVVLQPEIDYRHDGWSFWSAHGNFVVNLQGEAQPMEQGLTLAHELGHGLTLPHTWDDPSYPRGDGGMGPFVGLRYSPTFSVVPGTDEFGRTTAYDLMSYGWPWWLSPYNYCKALRVASGSRLVCPSTLRG
jgi:hypothetical protein